MQLNQLQRKTPNKSQKRVGRGGKRGKTSGRGTKGQKARAGHRIRPQIREELKKLPKRRGYSSPSIENRVYVVNVSALENVFSAGETVTPQLLRDRGLIRAPRGKGFSVKILGDGNLNKKLITSGCVVSASARAKIEQAGGAIA